MTPPPWSRRLALVALGLVLGACAPEEGDPIRDAITATTLGGVHLQEGRLPEAEAEFRNVVRLLPRAASGYANLAQVYLRWGRTAEAGRQVRRALARDSSNLDIHLLQARLHALAGRHHTARQVLERRLDASGSDPKVWWALAELAAASPDSVERGRAAEHLGRVVDADPANFAARIHLAEALAGRGDADGVLEQLEEVRRLVPALPPEAAGMLETAVRALQTTGLADAGPPLARFRRFMESVPEYQARLRRVQGPAGPMAGVPEVAFRLVPPQPGPAPVNADVIAFGDATADAGLAGLGGTVAAVGDFDGDGVDDLILDGRLLLNRSGRFVAADAAGPDPGDGITAVAVGDYDNDGRLDLYVSTGERSRLFRNTGSGTLRDVTAGVRLTDTGAVRRALFVDLDHDGDLDLVLVRADGNLLYRNNLDGGFTEMAGAPGLGRDRAGGRDAVFGDFDDDGRMDLFVVHEEGSDALYRNRGPQGFDDVAARAGVAGGGASGAVAAGDYNNDGFLDLFVAGRQGAPPILYRNRGDGTFEADHRAAAAMQVLRGLSASGAGFFDYDNDGHLDLAVVGEPLETGGRGVFLFRNDGQGGFEDRSGSLPADLGAPRAVMALDYDQDGDLDLVLAGGPGGPRLLRNDGGNANLFARVQLTALRTGSGKNNTFGIGARLELRAGDLYQMRVVTERVTHFGLGRHRSADAIRVEWPNGVPQVLSAGVSVEVKEEEILKGSCAFVYAWDGEGYRFVTDLMWKSALGMPVGIMGAGAHAYAPAGASVEYVRLPGHLLRPRDGRYLLQLTEELWETAYVDELKLLAVDHPDSVEVFVNERFVPPGPTPLRLYTAAGARPPRSARDGHGTNLLSALRDRDDRYAATLTPARYQGVTRPHELILDLEPGPTGEPVLLFLTGWLFPTDASINVAMAQSGGQEGTAPALDVRDARGEWRTAIPDLGFPSGKAKTVIADLTGKFPTGDRQVRIRTSMHIYWDQVFTARAASGTPMRVTTLEPVAADLRYRGFSRMFRKGGRYGPHWFDYDDVTEESPWRPIEGRFTRYGDVRPLLLAADDRYVVMGPGDAVQVEFETGAVPVLPPGWTRTFFVYSVGWIKDADLNTAHGATVEPLPFHAMSRYPHGPGEAYPTGRAHQDYLSTYHTREVNRLRRRFQGPAPRTIR